MLDRLQDAIDFAITTGLIKITAQNQIVHAPFSLIPYELTEAANSRLVKLTPIFNDLMMTIGQDIDFLAETLAEVARTDAFTSRLISLGRQSSSVQPLQMLLSRNDYMLAEADDATAELSAKQVEFNTISNSFPFLTTQTYRLHRYLYHGTETGSALVVNNTLDECIDALAETINRYDVPNACLLMVVQPGERNICDQRAMEYRLLEKHRIPTRRYTLAEIAEIGQLKNGHLELDGQIAALTYFRAGYTPDDYVSEMSWQGRDLIEAASSIKCPTIGAQLAGTKKIQQVLTTPDTLRKFASAADADQLEETFVGSYSPEALIEGKSILETVEQQPGGYVLKPQREGGGNNLYDHDMVRKIKQLSPDELKAYIVMERIRAKTHPAILVVAGKTSETQCISEIGRYGVCLKDGNRTLFNRDAGYLVRTKASDVNEGGVSAGFSCLNSMVLHSDWD